MIKNEDKYIIGESQEISIGEAEGWVQKFFSAFPAFKHRNYQLYFSGQLISLIGTWMQMVAQGWLVLQLTHSAFMVGLVSALGNLPTLILALFGGAIVDRFDKKRILFFTQLSSMILALILGILTVTNLINVYEIALLSALLGIINALDLPARQSFVIEMVGKKAMASAIALNSGTFNGARVIGPGIAGLIIASVGIGGAFILNGLSYIAVIIALFYIKVSKKTPRIHLKILESIKEGIVYAFSNTTIRMLLIFSAITSIFGWSYATIMPVIVQNIFHKGADSLGYFYSMAGAGALLGIILVSSFSSKINNLIFIIGGSMLFSISIILFSFTSNPTVAYPFLFLAGLGLVSEFSMINTAIQHIVDDHIRGRVMSIYALMFMGMLPLGSFQVGFFAEKFGSQNSIRIGGIIILVSAIILLINKKMLQVKNNYSSLNS